jgi:hypothetical protein
VLLPHPPPPPHQRSFLSQEAASVLHIIICFHSRRGVSNMALQEYDLAEKDLILARKLEPANR